MFHLNGRPPKLATLLAIALASSLSGMIQPPARAAAPAEKTGANPADAAWKELEKSLKPPVFPEEWQKNRPSEEEYAKFIIPFLLKGGKGASEFATKYPKHEKAAEARSRGTQMLGNAATLGSKEAQTELASLETESLKDKSLSEEERFKIRGGQVQRAAMTKESQGMAAVYKEFEAGTRQLLKEFPNRSEPYAMLLDVAGNVESERGRKIAQEILDSNADAEIKGQAKILVKKLGLVGNPLPIKFKAVDGRDVDVAAMKGKVVLIDFWATWCGPCVQEVPNVVAAYERLHPKGFEIVGISFDQSKESLTKFVAEKKMTWAQYFDGKGWKNEIGVEYGINGIPSMWLVDKKGNVRDLDGRESLAEKVEKLLAE